MTDVVTLGESLGILSAPDPGNLELASTLRVGICGAESNVAIGVSRLGGTAAWLGRIGDDDLGRRVLREIRAEGVAAYAIVDPSTATGLALKERSPAGRLRVRYYRRDSAGSRLEPGDVPEGLIASAGILHVTGITYSLSLSAEAAVRRAVDIAVGNGVPVSFDVNHRATLPRSRDAGEMYREVTARATILFAGEDEARLLVPGAADESELLNALIALGPREVILKLGERGCSALIEGSRYERAAISVRIVDSVGAGDAFVAGYLAERALGLDAGQRLDTAVRCGALACTDGGDWEGAPRRFSLDALDFTGDPVSR